MGHTVGARVAKALRTAMVACVARVRGRAGVRNVNTHIVVVIAVAVRIEAAHTEVVRLAGAVVAQRVERALGQRLPKSNVKQDPSQHGSQISVRQLVDE